MFISCEPGRAGGKELFVVSQSQLLVAHFGRDLKTSGCLDSFCANMGIPSNSLDVPSYATPIGQRKSRTIGSMMRGLAFGLLFDFGCLMINGFQFLCSPLYFLPATRGLYLAGVRYSKHAFGVLAGKLLNRSSK